MNKQTASSTAWLRYLTAVCVLPVAITAQASAQEAAAPEKKIPVETAPAATKPPAEEDDVLVLSPFTVDASKDKGYFAENTLAGSRMKTKLSDLGSSISVVTKQQMTDFASYDVNDIFRYEVNTEGSGTYTPGTQTFRNDGFLDVNSGGTQGSTVGSLTNAGANRVRGLAVPSASINYYQAVGAVPPDAYNTQSFEISRGPNSMLYGMGSPAGIVNQSTVQAKVTENSNHVDLATDDRGSFRSVFSFNRTLVKNKLAIYGALLYNDQEFERKPSYDLTRRQYAALTYKPFSKTTLSLNFENYNNSNRRPNTISPIDAITQWNLAGRPTYDSLTKKITINSTGKVVGPYLLNAQSLRAQEVRDYIIGTPGYNPALRGTSATTPGGTDTTFTFYNGAPLYGTVQALTNPTLSAANPNFSAFPLWVPGIAEQNQARSVMQIQNGQLQNWFQPLAGQNYRQGYSNPAGTEHTYPVDTFSTALTNSTRTALYANPIWGDVYDRSYLYSSPWTNNSFVTNVGSYKYPGVTDRSVLDWKKINVNQMNFGHLENQNYQAELTQEITKDLFASAGWFRQNTKQTTNYTVSQLNAAVVRIDINKYLPDGTPNPYFMKPFVADQDPDQYVNEEIDDHFRGMLAYTPDFTHLDGWRKWLGHHQFLGMWSRDDSMQLARRKRLNYVAAGSAAAAYRYLPNPNNGPITATSGPNGETGWSFGSGTSLARNFYLADPGAPYGVATRSSGPWDPQTVTGDIRVYNYSTNSRETANVTTTYNTFDSPVRSQSIINSLSTGMTNYLWKDRLILTFGARLDEYKVRQTTTGIVKGGNTDGTDMPALTNYQKITSDGYFNDTSMWNRFNPWSYVTGRTKTGGGVLRPFNGWSAIENRMNGNQFWQIVNSFGISYNWSDNFNAPTKAEVDPFGKPLPKPSGVGRDVGFQFEALNGKLFARVTWFEANNLNQRIAGDVVLSRFDSTTDTAQFRMWARNLAILNTGADPAVATPAAQEQAIQAATTQIWQLSSFNYYGDLPGTVTPTQDSKVKGMEAEINYNSGTWRNRFTFGSQETVNFNAYSQFDTWSAARLPFMKSATAAQFLNPAVLASLQAAATAAGHPGSVGYLNAGGTFVDMTTFWTAQNFPSSSQPGAPSTGISSGDQFGNVTPGAWYANNVLGNVTLAKALNGQAAPGQRKYHWAYNTGYDFTTRMLKGFGVGGAERWESKSVIGYLGKASGTTAGTAAYNPNLLDTSDTTKPVYDTENFYTDLFVRYQRKIWNEHVRMSIQLNVENVFEGGHLQTVGVNFDGSPYGYRIIDSRKFTLSAAFDF